MQNYSHYINEMLGQVYQDERLKKCLREEIQINPDRIRILHQIVMNHDCMSGKEIREKAYRYGKLIKDEELVARQVFLCLLRLADK